MRFLGQIFRRSSVTKSRNMSNREWNSKEASGLTSKLWPRRHGLSSSTLLIFLLISIWILSLLPSSDPAVIRRSLVRHGGLFGTLDDISCRIIEVETLFETNDESLASQVEHFCLPLVNGRESDKTLRVSLPEEIRTAYTSDIQQGLLHVSISDMYIENGAILMTYQSRVDVIDGPTNGRYLKTGTKGQRTVAVVRISTKDSQVYASAKEIEDTLFGNHVNFVSQYNACSFGKLIWKPSKYGVIDVKVDQPVASFPSPSDIVSAAEESIISKYKLDSASELADNVMYCVPPGAGNWAASAGVNYWRSQFNDAWCTSLTATMHELGHK